MSDVLTPIVARGELPALGNADWELLLSQARCTRLVGRLAVLRGHAPAVPAPPAVDDYFRGIRHWLQRQGQELAWELDRISRALLHEAATPLGPVVLLKGAAYLAAGLPPAQGRMFADIDLMVPRAQIEAAETALLAAGWISTERDAYTLRYYREWMHEVPPLTHVHRNTVIDLHHTITAPTSAFAVPGDALLPHVVPLPGWPGLFMLQPVDMVLHSAVHLFQEGEFDHGLRDLLDLNLLVLHFAVLPMPPGAAAGGFWPALFARAHELRLTVPLFHALVQLERLFGTRPVPPLAAADLRVPWASRFFMPRLLARALVPHHPACARWGDGLARFALYVRSHWLRMPFWMVVPHLVRKLWMHHHAPPRPGAQP